MKKIIAYLSMLLVFMGTFGTVSASDHINEMVSVEEMEQGEAFQFTYTLFEEVVTEGLIVKKFIEENTQEEIWTTTELPKEFVEILDTVDEKDKVDEAYHLLSLLFQENEAWVNMNALVGQYDDLMSPLDNFNVDEKLKRDMANRLKIVRDNIKKGEKLIVDVKGKGQYVDTISFDDTEVQLEFHNKEEAIKYLDQARKDLLKGDMNYYAGLFLVIVVALVAAVIYRRKIKYRGGV